MKTLAKYDNKVQLSLKGSSVLFCKIANMKNTYRIVFIVKYKRSESKGKIYYYYYNFRECFKTDEHATIFNIHNTCSNPFFQMVLNEIALNMMFGIFYL